jgi:hypothetical protein
VDFESSVMIFHFWWMTSCTYDMPRSACSVALETYHGASTIMLQSAQRKFSIN